MSIKQPKGTSKGGVMSKTAKIIIGVLGGLLGLAIIGVIAAFWLFSANIKVSNIITEEEAKQIAFEHAGVQEADVKMRRVKLDNEVLNSNYDIEFNVGNVEYDYEINAQTGHIDDFDVDGLDDEHYYEVVMESAPAGEQPKTQTEVGAVEESTSGTWNKTDPAVVDAKISEDEAAKTVLAKVPGAAESNLWIKTDIEDGRVVYEGKIIYDGTEYEFEIDANSGEMLSWETERAEPDEVPAEENYSEKQHHNQ